MLSTSNNEKDYLKVADEAPEVPKKNRSLLHVPLRSSSKKTTPSPTTTGLSGATVGDSRESIGGRSKESKASISGRRRNGSASSSKMSITPPGPAAGPTEDEHPTTATATRQPKKKGFLSLLCCGVPDHANSSDPSDVTPANKPAKVATGRPATTSRPGNGPLARQNSVPTQPRTEKEDSRQDLSIDNQEMVVNSDAGRTQQPGPNTPSAVNGSRNRSFSETRDQPLPELPKEAEEVSSGQIGRLNPSIAVQAPVKAESTPENATQEFSQVQKDVEGDVKMNDPEPPAPVAKEQTPPSVSQRDEGSNRQVLPPPPPVPQATEDTPVPEGSEQKQQWLLPPIAPRFKGKKCLVLDLDETLVHSSFKVCLKELSKVR